MDHGFPVSLSNSASDQKFYLRRYTGMTISSPNRISIRPIPAVPVAGIGRGSGGVAVFSGVNVGVFVGVFVGVLVGVFVGVEVGVLVGVFVGVFVGVGVNVGVLVGVFVGVAVGTLVGV